MKILCVGEEWRGSNASGLFYALSRIGFVTNIVNELKYVSVNASSFMGKAMNSLVRHFQIDDFNVHLKVAVKSFEPDLILVYKGAFLYPDTISHWKTRGIPVVNFFPDVSFTAHGSLISKCIPLYDYIFSTKTFASADLFREFGYDTKKVGFIPHGFDPLVHRRVVLTSANFTCDASFIGNYSDHKEDFLSALVEAQQNLDLKIWGGTWHQASRAVLKRFIQKVAVHGDLYASAINASTINIALLSERVKGASSGDQITSRTFHITGSGGFMIHERTEELLEYFKEDHEVACFSSKEELSDKVRYYLANDVEREAIRERGYVRANSHHGLDERAKMLIAKLKQVGLI